MLRSLLPKAHHKFLSLPLLGPITDGFDDWLAAGGFTRGSRKFSIWMLPRVDANLRRRRIDEVAKLNHAVLHDCWKALMKIYPCGAGTVHTLERYLMSSGLIVDGPADNSSDLDLERRLYESPAPSTRILCLHRFKPPANRAMLPPAPEGIRHRCGAYPRK